MRRQAIVRLRKMSSGGRSGQVDGQVTGLLWESQSRVCGSKFVGLVCGRDLCCARGEWWPLGEW